MTTIDSPRAMITKSWKRSEKCSLATSQAGGGDPLHPGDAVDEQRRAVVDRQGRKPEQRAGRIAVDEPAGDPEDPREAEPDEDVAGPAALVRPLRPGGEREEGMAADLDRHVGAGEQQRPLPPRGGDRDRHQQAAEHHPDHESAHGRGARVELVRRPGRVVPRPPDGEQDHRGLTGARPVQVREVVIEQVMGDLRDREDEDEVVEELQRRGAGMAVGGRLAAEAGHRSRKLCPM